MAVKTIITRLADRAAEKRAYNFMYGGAPYGGGGFAMNPYLGGMGYGGRWGGGGYGGVPMTAQSMSTPYGRAGYYGVDQRFVDPMIEQMNIRNHAAMRGMPGIDIGLQGQQADVTGRQQQVAAEGPLARLGIQAANYGMNEPQWADLTRDPRNQIGMQGQNQVNKYQAELDDIDAKIRAEHEKYNKSYGETGGAMQRASGSMFSKAQLASREGTGISAGIGRTLLGAGELFGADMGREKADAALAAREAHHGAGRAYQANVATLEQRRVEKLKQLEDEQTRHRQLNTLGTQANTQTGAREERARGANQIVEDTHRAGADPMRRAGEIGLQPSEAPVNPGQVRPPIQQRPAPAPTTQPPPRVPTPQPAGPHGPVKTACVANLADLAARIQLERQREKRAGLAEMLGGTNYSVPGAHTRTGLGKKIVGSSSLGGGKPSQLPQVAKSTPIKPNIDASILPAGVPSTVAHMPVETALSLGMTADQHAALRKLMGLS